MEDLRKQERELEEQLQQTQGQLAMVELQLHPDLPEHDKADLMKLKDDLAQLAELTREGLLEIKKQLLLLAFQSPYLTLQTNCDDVTEIRQTPPTTSGYATTGDMGATVAMETNEENPLHGMKCCAPIEESWGAVNYHNAMVMCTEPTDGDSEEDFSVRVLFTTPTYNAMKPCSFFLEGRCRYGDTECKFSHGHVVKISQLLPYQEPNFSLASVGGRCRARHTDGLWYEGVISSIEASLEYITVHFSKLNTTLMLDSSSVIPLAVSSDESSSDGVSDNDDGVSDNEEEEVRVLEWKPTGLQRALGEWEKHTTGIGSKLMAKMGYEIGKGLGRDSCGRVEPVDIVILPAGKSLDVCVQMREAKKLKNALGEPVGKKKRRKHTKSLEGQPSTEEHVDLFQFLNKKILKNDHDSSVEPSPEGRRYSQPVSTSGNLNLKLFQTHEEMKTAQRHLQRLKESLARQKGDKATEAHYKEKIAGIERQLLDLHRQEQSLQDGMKSKTERKKLSIF